MSDRLLSGSSFAFDHGDAWHGRLETLRHAAVAAWRRRVTRRRIAALDAHTLKDIGVSYAEAEAEANKPFWRA